MVSSYSAHFCSATISLLEIGEINIENYTILHLKGHKSYHNLQNTTKILWNISPSNVIRLTAKLLQLTSSLGQRH